MVLSREAAMVVVVGVVSPLFVTWAVGVVAMTSLVMMVVSVSVVESVETP